MPVCHLEKASAVLTFGDSFKIFWQSIRDLFDEVFVLMLANLVWVAINLPLMGLAIFLSVGAPALGLAAFLIGLLPLGPSTVGLYTIVERIADGRVAKAGQLFDGFRQYRRLSWNIYLPWGLGLAIILVNLYFYAQLSSTLGSFLFFAFLYLTLVWFALLIYIGPLLLIQRDKRLRVVARNASLMALGRPIYTLITLVLMGVIMFVSYWLILPLFLFTFSFLALWSYRATTRLIKDAEARQAAREAKTAGSESQMSGEKGRGGQVKPRE